MCTTKNPKPKKIFLFQTTRLSGSEGFEQLSNSISCHMMAFSRNGQNCLLWDMNFRPIFVFWAIILAPDMLENQSRSLKTQMIAVSKKTWVKKIIHWVAPKVRQHRFLARTYIYVVWYPTCWCWIPMVQGGLSWQPNRPHGYVPVYTKDHYQ